MLKSVVIHSPETLGSRTEPQYRGLGVDGLAGVAEWKDHGVRGALPWSLVRALGWIHRRR